MQVRSFLSPILDNDTVTRGLGDAEARVLIEWLVDQAERRLPELGDDGAARQEVQRLCGRARVLSRFVQLWCLEDNAGAALQLAATERFPWPLPTGRQEACDLMYEITTWEEAA